MKNQKHATIYGLSAVMLWSTVATAFKISLQHFSPLQLLFYSSLCCIMLLTAILGWQGKLQQVYHCIKTAPTHYLLLGTMNPFIYYLLLLQGYDLLPAQQAQPINYTWAITLTLLSIPILKQKITLLAFLACLVSYLGVLVISTKGELLSLNFSNPLGVLFLLTSTLFWALYWLLNTKQNHDPVVSLLACFLMGFPLLIISTAAFADFTIPHWHGFAGALYIGLFEMGFSFILWLNAMRLAENTAKISNLIFLAPFTSLIFIHYLLGESIHPATYVGLVLIITGIVLQQRLSHRSASIKGKKVAVN
ncbi:DMT family transporter [Endozoicomonas sp. SM1973]|uniref:DMT family transporter n=1 Tax=Spartinivicinus marinus TaxID=2994442 RepID=A0A853I4B5_9GAMM|nr:DMT family transporter [Spartinivicinus marinus]MCX4028859.1 DMT family transporter [Spartinivicinus marinus]NYZ65558.1 DMT family transporter [Spartinivicinus marinus]